MDTIAILRSFLLSGLLLNLFHFRLSGANLFFISFHLFASFPGLSAVLAVLLFLRVKPVAILLLLLV
jgi:hypothetical protein